MAFRATCVALALALTSCGSDTGEVVEVPVSEWKTNTALRELSVFPVQDGVMSSPLNVELLTRKIDNLVVEGCPEVTTSSYSGEVPGPTIRIKAGNTIGPLLTNDLPPETQVMPADWPINIPHQPNYTNLHTHGLHVSPGSNPNGTQNDNVLVAIKPGGSVQYQIAVPADHPPGTHFYHPHRHGSVLLGMMAGLSGVIIIEDPPGQMPSWIADAPERTLVIQQVQIQPPPDCNNLTIDYNNPPTTAWSTSDLVVATHPQGAFNLINGQHRPVITMRPGQVERWRTVNATSNATYSLALVPVTSTASANPDLRIIARDGLTLEYAETPLDLQSPDGPPANPPGNAYNRQWQLFAGNRVDVMVQAPSSPGVFKLQAILDGDRSKDAQPILAYLVVEGESVEMEFPPPGSPTTPAEALPSPWGPGRFFPQTFAGLPTSRNPQMGYYVCAKNHESDACKGAWVRYGSRPIPPPEPIFAASGPDPDESGGETPGTNGNFVPLLFDPKRIDHCMELGTVEEWTICNPSTAPHPFHIHTNAYEVLSINGIKLLPAVATNPGNRSILWLDVVGVPGQRLREPTDFGPWPCNRWDKDDPDDIAAGPPEMLAGSVVMRTEPITFTGFMMQHCHFLRHEDTGMMQLIEIYDPMGPSTTNPASGQLSRCTNELPAP